MYSFATPLPWDGHIWVTHYTTNNTATLGRRRSWVTYYTTTVKPNNKGGTPDNAFQQQESVPVGHAPCVTEYTGSIAGSRDAAVQFMRGT